MISFRAHLKRAARAAYYLAVFVVALYVLPHLLTLCGLQSDHGGLLLANTFATPAWVMRKVARRLVNRAVFAGNVNRSYDDEYRQKGAKMGDTVTARLPQRYEVSIGAVMNPTPLTDQTVAISITDQSNIGFEYDSWSATLYVDDYMERYGNPAVDALVNNIDYTGLLRCYKDVATTVGTPGVVPGSTGTLPQAANQPYLDAVTELFDAAAPDPYSAVLDANAHAYLVNGNITLFNPSAQIAAQFREAEFQRGALGIDRWFKSQNVAMHTVGALGGTPVIDGAGQVGSSINIRGGSNNITSYWKQGDNVLFAGVFSINPLSHQSTGRLKDFVATADMNTDGSGKGALQIAPELIVAGPFATSFVSPADGAAATTFGHASAYAGLQTRQSLIFNKDAFALVMADLILPRGLWVSERISNAKLGISIRMLKDHDIINDVSPARLDTAHGWKVIRRELAARLCTS